MVVSRSYLPAALPIVAQKAVSVRVWENLVLSNGIVLMNQPTPLASLSMRSVAPLGHPYWSNLVSWASGS